jgi:glycosyltransferase involved in cell wall biosynthesis
MTFLFLGPVPLAGIGQVTMKYAQLMNGEYCQFGQTPSMKSYDVGFAFILPVAWQLVHVRKMATLCKKMIYMTVCETETVHESYADLLEFQPIHCPSEFSRNVLQRQFPQGDWRILRHWTPEVPIEQPMDKTTYTFYTIGNITDPRKNIKQLIDVFVSLRLPGSRLVLKATCNTPVQISIPGVIVMNGLMSEEQLESVHRCGDCYINCSHSEGVGMGAVEAAMRDKPCIISEYGGLKEYVKTPYVIPCAMCPVGQDDFLFKKDMIWGDPCMSDLARFMKECYMLRLRTQDHSFTRGLVRSVATEFLQSTA